MEVLVAGDVEPVERRAYPEGGWVESAYRIRMRVHDGRIGIEWTDDDPSSRALLP